jgi:hypothetical protein
MFGTGVLGVAGLVRRKLQLGEHHPFLRPSASFGSAALVVQSNVLRHLKVASGD